MNAFMEFVFWTLVITFFSIVAFKTGEDYGKKQHNHEMWENPPGMSYCVVYKDGGKKCTKEVELPPLSLSECIRQCRHLTRMEKIK